MNTDLIKEELERLENDLNYDTSDDPRVTRLVSMARRTLQAEERLERAVEALKFYADEDNYRSISIRFAHEVDLDCGNKARSVLLSLDSPKDLPPPTPCAPPAHSDAQPVCKHCHGRGGWEGGVAGETWHECPECNGIDPTLNGEAY